MFLSQIQISQLILASLFKGFSFFAAKMRKKLTRYRLNENLIELELFLRGKIAIFHFVRPFKRKRLKKLTWSLKDTIFLRKNEFYKIA